MFMRYHFNATYSLLLLFCLYGDSKKEEKCFEWLKGMDVSIRMFS